ncbi:MAG: response regulator [Planctomycetota bacterium]
MEPAKENTDSAAEVHSDRRRILIIDDNSAIHDDIGRVLQEDDNAEELDELEAELFGTSVQEKKASPFVTESAFQGKEGYLMVKKAVEAGEPYMLAFVDMRMPPGWDGLETIQHIWKVDPEIQVVICTAFSDHSWDSIVHVLGHADRLLILKKPFDVMEVTQLAWALTQKWILARRAQMKRDELEGLVTARTTSLEAARQELLAVNEELAVARDKARAANNMKSEFLAAMSHEIRTPLNGVIGTTSLLMETDLNRQQADYVETVSSSADTLLTIINEVLDISKIEAGKMSLEHRSFDIRRAVDQVAELLAAESGPKSIQLVARFKNNVPRCLIGDEVRIRQVLTNLVGNAIKFTHEGHVLINIVYRPEATDGQSLAIAVEDTGIGIPEDKLALIFGAYDQADAFTAIKYGGTGLGLAISKKLCELMGGRISVTSKLGEGSRFTMYLPLAVDNSNAELAEPPSSLKNVSAVVLSPRKIMRALLKEQFFDWGIQLSMAATVEEALATTRELHNAGVPPRIMVVDQADGVTDESQILLALQGEGLLGRLPVLLLAEPVQSDRNRGIESAGYAASLTKPVRMERLAMLMTEVLDAVRQGRKPIAVTGADFRVQHTQARLSGDPSRPGAANVLLADDNSINQKVAAQMLQRLGCRVEVASDGQQAIEMYRDGGYDLILMDCEMPQVDGFEATRQIRGSEGGDRRIPIIAMTANAMSGDRQRCLEAGMDDYVSKPYRLKDLQATLERWIGGEEKA